MWNSVMEMLLKLNDTDKKMIVLRNFERYNYGDFSGHDDIDLLCDDPDTFKQLIGGEEVECRKRKIQLLVMIAGQEVSVDLRYVGDGYMDEKWEKDMLSRRVAYNDTIYVPNHEDYVYSLLYHGFYHKRVLKTDYLTRVLTVSEEYNMGLREDNLFDMLNRYMDVNGYSDTGYRCG